MRKVTLKLLVKVKLFIEDLDGCKSREKAIYPKILDYTGGFLKY